MTRPRVLINALSMSEGGGRSYVLNLLREIGRDDRGFSFTVLAQRDQLDAIDGHGIPVRAVRLPDRARVVWRVAYEELVMPLTAARFDLLYCIADLVPRFPATRTVALLCNLNIYDHRWYDDLRIRTLERLVRFGVASAHRVVFPTRAAADAIGACLPLDRDCVRVVPFGIALEGSPSSAPLTTRSARYVFLPAAIEKHKNIEVLIDGLARAADRELELWIAGRSLGDPEHLDVLRSRARSAGVESRVRFLGAVPYPGVLDYYRDAYAFAFPSFIETFGFPLLEAMALGAPAVVSDIPAFREIAGEAALYFAPDDPAAAARALDSLREDPESMRRRVSIGRERAAQFTWKASVDALCAVFNEALDRPRP